MTLPCKNFLALAGFTVITNGFALLGIGQASIGSVARAIECNTAIAANVAVSASLRQIAGNPPSKREMGFGRFVVGEMA